VYEHGSVLMKQLEHNSQLPYAETVKAVVPASNLLRELPPRDPEDVPS
jgi:hypothetical protein